MKTERRSRSNKQVRAALWDSYKRLRPYLPSSTCDGLFEEISKTKIGHEGITKTELAALQEQLKLLEVEITEDNRLKYKKEHKSDAQKDKDYKFNNPNYDGLTICPGGLNVITGAFKTHMPYCIVEAETAYKVLNYRKLPVGIISTKCNLRIEDIGFNFPMSHNIAKNLSCRKVTTRREIYLYDETCLPWETADNMKAYLKRMLYLYTFELRRFALDDLNL